MFIAADGEGHDVPRGLQAAFERLKWILDRLITPLKRGEGPNKFRLSMPETATTTFDGSVGWANRPPAFVECPQCGSYIRQDTAHDSIDCPRCVAVFDSNEFVELPLLALECPVCRSRMEHGQRHPHRFDFPEWATCNGCRYHWEFEHAYP